MEKILWLFDQSNQTREIQFYTVIDFIELPTCFDPITGLLRGYSRMEKYAFERH